MRILFIAPLPPPITGHSIVSEVLKEELEKQGSQIVSVDLSKDSFKEGIDGFKRIVEVVGILKQIWQRKKGCDRIYLTISESMAGNIKDLFIYLICFRSLSKTYIHLHGGSIKRQLWDHRPWLQRINAFFIKRMGGVIISGKSHIPIFSDIIAADRIHIIPNFALEYLFIQPEMIARKFKERPLRILYMSNMITKKGYNELADGYIALKPEIRENISVSFAGKFESVEDKTFFLAKIADYKGIKFHGSVSEEMKKQLFQDAHVFCLPTSYFEGQPISILEAYAAGCVVVTTGQSGIRDIFEEGKNGYEIEPRSSESLTKQLTAIHNAETDAISKIAHHNRTIAEMLYRRSIYGASVGSVISGDSEV